MATQRLSLPILFGLALILGQNHLSLEPIAIILPPFLEDKGIIRTKAPKTSRQPRSQYKNTNS